MFYDDTFSRLAVIPARGGSTRLKDKNTYPLGGKPLICHTIEAVIESDCFDTIIVSTDSEAIADVARKYSDVEIYARPAEYAGERVTVLKALVAMMDDIIYHDIFAYFLPTCPFRDSEDIRRGVELLQPGTDAVMSISQYSQPPQLAMLKKGDDIFPVFDNLTSGVTNSKYFTKYYKPNGGYYMAWWDHLKKTENFFVGNIKGCELSQEHSVDIDNIFDMNFAEHMLNEVSL